MSALDEQHQHAMALAEQALITRATGGPEQAKPFFERALAAELTAVELARLQQIAEPTFSILHRSAASLAVNCGDYRTAEKLIGYCLSGEPPADVLEELRDLLETVHFSRHLEVSGVTLATDELQLSVAGRAVGYGLALSDLFVHRVEHTSKLIYRTVERYLKKPFRETGTVAKVVREFCQLYMSVPREASLAVSLKIGRPTQQTYDAEIAGVTTILDDVLDCLMLINEGKTSELRERIANDAYYNNFVGLAKLIAPDGENLKLVGFTTIRYGQERHVALTRPSENIVPAPKVTYVGLSAELVKIKGRLLFADALKTRQIKIVDGNGKQHAIEVPTGMMADVVKPLWESDAIATARHTPSGLLLEGISEVVPEDVSDFRLYYVNLGDGPDRSWEDNRTYGFVSAGFDRKYSSQLERLHTGDRIFAYLKATGFVGYGIVVSRPTPCRDFISPVTHSRLTEVELSNSNILHDLDDLDRCEWLVAINWLRTFARDDARTFPGIFTNENIACRLSDPATVVFLMDQFDPANG